MISYLRRIMESQIQLVLQKLNPFMKILISRFDKNTLKLLDN